LEVQSAILAVVCPTPQLLQPVKATVGGISPQAVHLILIEFHKTPGSSHINLLQILS
jgi:hypothetical protein